MLRLLACLGVSLAAAGCATGSPASVRAGSGEGYAPFIRGAVRPEPPLLPSGGRRLAVGPEARAQVVERARGLLGQDSVVLDGKRWGEDCTAVARAAYAPLGLELMSSGEPGDNGVTAIFRTASAAGEVTRTGAPRPGDLVFFRETYDLNRDGAVNDGLTHIAVVEAVEADGTVTLIHRVSRGVVRGRMNLANPYSPVSPSGAVHNDWLRAKSAASPPKLTGELFAGYGVLLP